MSLETLAAQAEGLGAEFEAEGAPGEQAQAVPPITNAQAFAGAVGAAREAFCFFTKLESPRVVLTDDKVGQLGALWGPVFDKHGVNLGDLMGDYALEFTAIVGTISIVGELRQAVGAEIAARKPAPKAEQPDVIDEARTDGPSACKPLVIAALGGRGSGKSAWVKQLPSVAQAKRLLVWDYMHEYQQTAKPVGSLPEVIRAMGQESWRIAYQVKHGTELQAFDLICKAVKEAKRCTLIAEELAFVTQPNKAPPAWRELCLIGRHATHAQATLIGISQRPASIDKDFLACCDVIHCGRLLYEPDAKAVAPFIGCDWRDLTQLADLHYIERTAGGELRRGVLDFAKKTTKKPPEKPAGAPRLRRKS